MTGTELNTLTGHQGAVTSVSFSPDGKRIASGSGDRIASGSGDIGPGEIKLWDALTGTELNTLTGHRGAVTSVSFSPDGTRLASGSSDHTIKMWDTSTGTETITLKGHGQGVTSVSFSPDGSRIASGAGLGTSGQQAGGEVKLWDASAGTALATLKGHESGVTSVHFSPDGTRLVSGAAALGQPGEIKLWDALTGTELTTLRGHQDSVHSVSFSPDGTRIASGSGDQTIKIWDASTGTELTTLVGHLLPVHCVSFSPDGTRLATGDVDGTIRLWNTLAGTELTLLKGDEIECTSVSFSPDGTRLATGGGDGTIRLWNSLTGIELTLLKGEESECTSVNFSPDGTRIASAQLDWVTLWDVSTGTELITLRGHQGGVTSISFSSDGTRIATGSWDRTIKLWDASTGTELTNLSGHGDHVRAVSFSLDGTKMLSTYYGDSKEILWKVPTGERLPPEELPEELSQFLVSTSPPFGLGPKTRSPNGRWLAVKAGNVVQLCDMAYKGTPQERTRRELMARPKPSWHTEQMQVAVSGQKYFQALFHAGWLLQISPSDAWCYDDLHEIYRLLLAVSGDKTSQFPSVAVEMLKLPRGTEHPQLNEESASALEILVWELVRLPAVEGTSTVSDCHLQRMQDVCSRFAKGSYFNTLGVLQYRLGRFEDAIVSLNKSIELSPAETGDPAPSPLDLGFLAMSYFKTNDSVKSNEMYEAFRSTVSLAKWNLQPDIQRLIDEVETTLQKSTPGEAAVSIEGFNREATFEGLYRHHWQFRPDERYVASFGLASENVHDGQTCLQAGSQNGPVMTYQTINVEPNTKYRLTGWIRYELPPTDPAGESTPAASDQAEAVPATATTETESPSEPSSTPIPGASIGLLNRPETSEVISATSDWKQVTLEFTTTETETTISPGFRLGLEGQQITGTAWFDDLTLEKVE